MKLKEIANIIGDADFDIIGNAIVFHGLNHEAKHTINEVCDLYKNLGATICHRHYDGEAISKNDLASIKLALSDNKELSWVNAILNADNASIILEGAEFIYAVDKIPAGAVVHIPHTDISRIYSRVMNVELLLDVRLSPLGIAAAEYITVKHLEL